MTQTIYLDHNATTPIDLSAVEAMRQCYAEGMANAGSQHSLGRRARLRLEDVREQIIRLLGAQSGTAASDRFIFTSGGTEANNLALLGMSGEGPGRVIVSSIEHPSVLATAPVLRQRGWRVDLVEADASGMIDLAHFDRLLDQDPPPKLVSIMLANNETGVVQPLGEVVRRCQSRGVLVHTDAVQAVGKLPVNFSALGVDALSLAAHKVQGPCGIGGLLIKRRVNLRPILFGGAQQLSQRPGTEPVALAVGMLASLQKWVDEREDRHRRMLECRDRLAEKIQKGEPTALFNGAEPRLSNTLNVSFCGLDRQALMMALDLAGIACSTGSACASGSSEPSHVLKAMGLEKARIEGSIRLSVGATTTVAEVDQAAERILRTISRLRSQERSPNSTVATREEGSKSL